MKIWIKATALLISLSVTATVNATIFYLDEFTVTSGNYNFTDTFSDGQPPPSGSNGANTYLTQGDFGPESGGRLKIDTLRGVLRNTSVTGNERYVQRSRLRTNATNDLSIPGLKIDNDISVLGRFDFIAANLNRERYSIRLTDFRSGRVANDNVEVGVFRNARGNFSIQFREADFAADVFNVLGSYTLDSSYFDLYEQINLNLFSNANDNSVFAGFELFDLDGGLNSLAYEFNATGNIFDGENWTRAGIITTAPVILAVPEPASLALFGLGLIGLGLMKRGDKHI